MSYLRDPMLSEEESINSQTNTEASQHEDFMSGQSRIQNAAILGMASYMDDEDDYAYELPSRFSRFWNSSWSVVVGATIGIGLGLFISSRSGTMDTSLAKWISLPGELFLNALKCLVVPMVFTSLTVGIADIIGVGKASAIGWRLFSLVIFTSTIAAGEGIVMGVLFKPLFRDHGYQKANKEAKVAIKCKASNTYLEVNPLNGSLACTATNTNSNNTMFVVNDMKNTFKLTTTAVADLSFSDQLLSIFRQIFPVNLVQSFSDSTLPSIIMFAILFGAAVGKSIKYISPLGNMKNPLLEIIRLIDGILQTLIKWAIKLTPLAVISLIAGSFAENERSLDMFKTMGFFILALLSAIFFHVFLTLPLIFFLFTRSNPYRFLYQVFPSMVFAFGCASSIATLPISIRCVDKTRQVSRFLSRFVLSIGATVNMDGIALMLPMTVIYLTESTNTDLTTLQYAFLLIISVLGSLGAAPVPNSGLVVMVSVWRTISPADLPKAFLLFVASDWFNDRFQTVANVTSDMLLVRIIATQVDETYLDERERLDERD